MAERKYKSDNAHKRQAYRPHNYNNTSSAYDFAAQEEYVPKTKVLKKRKVKRGRQEVYVRATDKAGRPSVMIFAAMIVMALGIGMSVVSYSLVATQNMTNNNLRSELKTMQSRTAELSVEVSQSMDLEEIERIARTRLEMSEPQFHQIVHVSVPKENYTVHLPDTNEINYAKAETGLNGFESFMNLFKKD